MIWIRTHTYLTPQPFAIPPCPPLPALLPALAAAGAAAALWNAAPEQQGAATSITALLLELMRAPQVRAVTHSPHFAASIWLPAASSAARALPITAAASPPSSHYTHSFIILIKPNKLSPPVCAGAARLSMQGCSKACLGQRCWAMASWGCPHSHPSARLAANLAGADLQAKLAVISSLSSQNY